MAQRLDIVADLTLALDGEEIAVRGHGNRLVVDLPSLGAGWALFRTGPFSQVQRRAGLTRMNTALRDAGLTIDVRLLDETVARIGAQARPNAAARLLNLGAVEVRPTRSMGAAVRRWPGWTFGVVATLAALVSFVLFWRSRRE